MKMQKNFNFSTVDKLYLEWSQITRARTRRENALGSIINNILMLAISSQNDSVTKNEIKREIETVRQSLISSGIEWP